MHVLTHPLPAHIADFREPARTLLLLVALVLVLGTMAFPQRGEVAREAVLFLAGIVALTTALSLLPRFQPMLNRVGGLLVLGQVGALVYLTGGARSIYSSLYILLLLYAAVFYGSARLLATVLVVVVVFLMPVLIPPVDRALLTELTLRATIWIVAVATVHWLVARMRISAQTDGLTALWNHVTFWELLRAAHEQHARNGSRYSVLMLDLDHFKRVNDTHGHPAGDRILRQVAELLRARCRRSDVVARYGGEEFAILLPDTGRGAAIALAKELRLLVVAASLRAPVTVSIGVACSADVPGSGDEVVDAADRALYQAKVAGRNHVAVALPGPAGSTDVAGIEAPAACPGAR